MKRKTILWGGVFLIIFYSLAFIVSVAFGAAATIYFFVNDTIQIINDLLLPIIRPFLQYGKVIMLVSIGALIVTTLLMLIGSSRFIKHAYSSAEVYGKKKKMLIFYFILAILIFGALCYLLISAIINDSNFMNNLLINGFLIFGVVAHLASLILIFVGLNKYKASVTYVAPTESTPEPTQIAEVETQTRPAIYTSGLDPDEKPKSVSQQKPIEQTKKPVQARGVESDNTKKLIEAIGILDQKRKEGVISTQEYTRLRAEMIKRFVS